MFDDYSSDNFDQRVVLIVLEQGAPWPTSLADSGHEIAGSVVVAQSPLEPEPDFAHRVLRKLAGIQADSEMELTSAFLVSNGIDNPACTDARIRIARGIMTAMSADVDSEVVLTACRNAGDGHASHQLLALAGVLCEGLRGSRVTVRVRLDEPHAESGIRPRAPLVSTRPLEEALAK